MGEFPRKSDGRRVFDGLPKSPTGKLLRRRLLGT